jgi:hypothetical protein
MVTYESWLNRVFGRTKHQSGPEFDAEPATLVDLIGRTLAHCGRDLTRFSDKQVNRGLWALFQYPLVSPLQDPTVPATARTASILAIKTLYTDCFMRRARPVLSHCNEPGASPVNSICYMLWDITPIGVWGTVAGCAYFDLALEVLEYALYLPHPACVESALHGLGHLGGGTARRVHTVIERWRTQGAPSRSELLTYAECADEGLLL